MIRYITGDLIELFKAGQFDIIAHGCNCFHTMNSGIAKQIKENFPDTYNIDFNTTKKGDINKLGTFSIGQYWRKIEYVNIYNCYTQYYYGKDGKLYLEYDALALCLRKINFVNNKGLKVTNIGLPKIGCGLAGGEWNKVDGIIQRELKDLDITIVTL